MGWKPGVCGVESLGLEVFFWHVLLCFLLHDEL